jgi:hypothetical protein
MPPTLTLPPNPPAEGKAAGNLHGPLTHHLPPPATLDASPAPIVDLLDAIWHRVMEMRFACYDEARKTLDKHPAQRFTPFALQALKNSVDDAQQHRLVERGSDFAGSVTTYVQWHPSYS